MILMQHHKAIGIFACDSASVLCTTPDDLPGAFDQIQVVKFESAPVGISDVGFAANAELFRNAWRSINADGRYRRFDWTVKVDPDTVFIPSRLERVLRPRSGQTVFFKNCGMFNISALYGSIEVVARSALEAFLQEGDVDCAPMIDEPWGEDLYLQRCLEKVGAQGLTELGIMSDQRCWESALPISQGCRDVKRPSFHPFKSLSNWTACWTQTAEAEALLRKQRSADEAQRRQEMKGNQIAARKRREKQMAARRQWWEHQDAQHKAKADAQLMEGVYARPIGPDVEEHEVDMYSPEFLSKALARTDTLKKLLRIGDHVRVRDMASTRWRKGNVTSAEPLAVRPRGWTVGFAWDIVEPIPFTDMVRPGDRVRVASGRDSEPDVQEGPLRPGDMGVVQEWRATLTSQDASVLVRFAGVSWWYRQSSLAVDLPSPPPTCDTMGCHTEGSNRPCGCSPDCISSGGCCADFVDACLLRHHSFQRFG